MAFVDYLEQGVNAYFACMPRKKPRDPHLSHVQLIAHRGAHHPLHAIENTLPAFNLAYRLGCWGIELDIQLTKDKVFVVNHDPTLHRLWGIDAAISDLSVKELHEMAPLIPTLAEVIEKYGGKMHLFIEIKSPFNDEARLSAVLACLKPGYDYHLLSLEAALFSSFVLFPSSSCLLVANVHNTAAFCRLSIQGQYAGVLGHYLFFNQSIIHALLRAEQKMGVGFVNSRYSLYREVNRGLYWLFSDNVYQIVPHLSLESRDNNAC